MNTNSFVTLFRFEETTGEYTRIGSFAAWVYRQSRTRSDSGGTYPHDVFDVRIPCKIKDGVKTDDLIAFEKTSASAPVIENCSRVAAVTQNRIGSCPHWHIEAETRYR